MDLTCRMVGSWLKITVRSMWVIERENAPWCIPVERPILIRVDFEKFIKRTDKYPNGATRRFPVSETPVLRMRVAAWLYISWFSISSSFSLPNKRDSESSETSFPDLYEAGIVEIQSGLEKGLFTSVDLVKVRRFNKNNETTSITILFDSRHI